MRGRGILRSYCQREPEMLNSGSKGKFMIKLITSVYRKLALPAIVVYEAAATSFLILRQAQLIFSI